MAINATQIRRGNVIVVDGDPCRVIEFHHHTPGNLRAFVQAKLRNLRTGTQFERRFRAADTLDRAVLETHELQFLYHDGQIYHFMNSETFEQVPLDDEAIGEAGRWLSEGMTIQAEFYEGKPIGISLPKSLELKVELTDPPIQGATKSAMTKPATLENGVVVQVPAFVDVGDTLRVDPAEEKYMERVLR